MLGSPRRYYAFTAGPARVIVLDGNAPADPGQLSFLRREMARPAERVRIVAVHQPLCTSGIHGASPAQQRLWAPLFGSGRVALVLQGHNHMYERIERDGITYVTTGGGGDRLYPCVRRTPGLRACALDFHFLVVTAGERAIDVRAVTPARAHHRAREHPGPARPERQAAGGPRGRRRPRPTRSPRAR